MVASVARNQCARSSRLLSAGVDTRSLIQRSCKDFRRSFISTQAHGAQNSPVALWLRRDQPISRYSTLPSIWSSSGNLSSAHKLNIATTHTFSTTPPRPQTTNPKIPLQIRPIQASDEPAFKSLWSQYNEFYKRTIPSEVTDTTFKRFLDPKIRMYAAVAVDASSDNKVIGFITWYPHLSTSSIKEQVYAHDAFVDPSVRNMGAARAMIEYVYEHAQTELGASLVYWHTQHYNHRAQLLYVKVAERTDFVKYQKNL